MGYLLRENPRVFSAGNKGCPDLFGATPAHPPHFRARSSRGRPPSLRSVEAVACVAEPGDDVAVLVEALVDGCGIDRHVGVRLLQVLDSFRRGEETDKTDVLGAALLQLF